MRPKTYNEDQLNIIKKYYPDGNWDAIMPSFPGKDKAYVRAIARINDIKRKKDFTKNIDLTGQRIGNLTVISKTEGKKHFTYWKCKCDCGKETIVDVYSLTKKTTKSCGCLRHKKAINAKDFTGRKFGLLTAIERLDNYNGKGTFYRCQCECGREKIVCSGNLSSGHTRSCGVMNHKKKEFDAINVNHDDTKQNYKVYRHISPSGKSYIGITRQDPNRRFQNGIGYKTQIAFCRAIEKYGWENFKHEILEENLTEKEACEKETYYIEKVFKSIAPNGYNTREGGTTGRITVMPIIQYFNESPVNFFESITEASKELRIAQKTINIHCGIENAVKGYYFTKMGRIAPYNVPDEYWEMHDEKHLKIMKEIIAEDTREKTIARNKGTARAINQYDLKGHYIQTFSSIIEAQKTIGGCDGGAIHAAVNPKRQGHTAYNYQWKYDDGDHSDISPVKYKAQKVVLKIDTISGNIVCEYKSISEAARALGVNNKKITAACSGDVTLFKDFKLQYKE